MKTLGVPDWMGFYLSVRAKSAGLSESDNYLNGAGRALGFVRMAACELDEPYSRQEVGNTMPTPESVLLEQLLMPRLLGAMDH